MDRYLVPVLRRLGAARPASDVYRVFDQIPADPKVSDAIAPLVAKLDSDDGAVRDAAAAALKRMGRPATIACLRLDPATLSPEQKNRLAAIHASEGWLHLVDLEAARADEAFLASCTEDEDEAVRTAASNQLAAVRAGKRLRFN
jgi:HEAT repeat protein